MQPARSRAAHAVRPLCRQLQRRSASSGGPSSAHSAAGDAHAAEHANVNETFGARFFLTLTAMPLAWLAYDATTSDADHPSTLTRWIGSYDSWQREFERRNDTHARLVHQAALDRNLFGSTEPSRMVDLKFPEQFNTGSPYNNVAGHRADLRDLVAHYQKRNQETEEHVAGKSEEERKLA